MPVAVPSACSSATVPTPGGGSPAGAASVTGSAGRRECSRESSHSERCHRRSSSEERSQLSKKRRGGRSPSPARSSCLGSASASSSSTSSVADVSEGVIHPPPAGRSGTGGGRSERDRLAAGCDRSHCPGPSGLGLGSRSLGSGRSVKVRCPFRLPPAAPAAYVGVPRRSPPDRVSRPLRVGGCLSTHWRHWQAEFCVLSVLRDGYRIPFLDSPPSIARTLISFPTYRSGSPQSLVLGQEIEKMLAKDALEIVLDPGPGFYLYLYTLAISPSLGGSRQHKRQQTPERCIFPNTCSGIEEAIEVPVRRGSLPVQGLVLWTVDCPSGLHQGVCSSLCMGSLPQDSSSQVPGQLAGLGLLGGHGQKERSGSALALSLPRDSDKQGEVRSRPLADCKLPRYNH